MKIKKCYNCGEPVISMTQKCPKCGVIPKRAAMPLIIAATAALGLILAVIAGLVLL